jgi:hypothetical protein
VTKVEPVMLALKGLKVPLVVKVTKVLKDLLVVKALKVPLV